MSLENPYRAAGAFSGKAYIRRDADGQLLEHIEENQYYPYFAAPRQSGKSSLLLRTMAQLDPARYRVALVDLSPFVVTSYDDFWRQFLHEVARSANFDPAPISQEDPRDVFLLWLRTCKQRLIVFMDEIDVLLSVDCREQIFAKFRTFYNQRAKLETADLQRVQFVLAGAAHSSRFIKDPRWSPFNVTIEVELEDLSPAQVSQLAVYLATAGSFAGSDLTARVHELTGGSVFLCQLVFEQLWNLAARGKSRLDAGDVDAVVATIVGESPRNIHFYNIFRLVTADARLTMLFRRLTEGQELGQEEAKELRLTGLCRGAAPFRNEIYARVFGPGGPLDLKVGDRQIQLAKALDAAIARRDHLKDNPGPEPRALAVAEAEIAKLRRAFREGTQLQVGDVLGHGRFRLEEKIGQGGFAAVWRALDSRDGKQVALKVLHGQFAEDKSRRDRFFRGAWKMSELQHPAIVRVLEPYGDENGRYYFVMEYLRGGTLHTAVQDGQIAGPRALKLLEQVGTALQFAHSRGLVHRDVKPSNVMIDLGGPGQEPQGKLTDFDLVREADITGGTRTGAMGTFIYAAPEVMARPQDADARADVYGLGMTAVFALYGGDLAMDVIRDADRFIDRLPCNPVLKDVLKKAVAWDLNDRFATAGELVAALERAAEVEPATGHKSLVMAAAPANASRPAPAPRAASAERAPAVPAMAAVAPALAAVTPAQRVPTIAPGAMATPQGGGGASGQGAKATSAAKIAGDPGIAGDAMRGGKARDEAPRDVGALELDAALREVPDDEDVAAAGEAGPWNQEILVPERTDTKMLRAAVERGEPAAAQRRSRSMSVANTVSLGKPVTRAPSTRSASASATAIERPRGHKTWPEGQAVSAGSDAQAAPEERTVSGPLPAPPPQASARRLPVFWMGLAASLLLVLVAQNLLQPDPLERALQVEPGAEPPTPLPSPHQPPAIPDADATTTGPTDGSGGPRHHETQTAGEAGAVTAVKPSASGAPPTDPTAHPTAGSGETAPPDLQDPTKADAGDVDPPRHVPSAAEQIDEGCIQVRLGDAGRGVEMLTAAHDSKPGNIRLMMCLADGYMKLGKYESALSFYDKVLVASRRHTKALLGAAQANEALNRRTVAGQLYQRLLDEDPDNASARAFLAAEGKRDDRPPVRGEGPMKIPLTPR